MIESATQELMDVLEPMGDGTTIQEKAHLAYLKGKALDASEFYSPEAERHLSRAVL